MKSKFHLWAVTLLLASASLQASPVLDFSGGFTGSNTSLNYNGSAQISVARARINDGGAIEVGSVWSKNQVNIRGFDCQFTFLISAPNEAGFTFTIQRAGNTVLGYPYESLGFTPMTPSCAIKFGIWRDGQPNVSVTGLYLNGAFPFDDPPSAASIDMTPSGIDLHSQRVFAVHLTYDGTTLHETVTDTMTNAVFTQDYAVDLLGTLGGNDAYVGFTGSTGGSGCIPEILSWTYTVVPSSYQVDFSAFPEALQVYPRNRMTNTAVVPVAGTESFGGYTQAVLRVCRNGVQVGPDQVQDLVYSGGQAPFSFNPTITAELAHYDVEVLLRDNSNQLTSVQKTEDIVAGDVIVIQGQSNAVAKEISGSSSAYISPFIRTIGLESYWPPASTSFGSWMIATGDGAPNEEDPGVVGQWGLVMANQIMTANNVPVAVMNGGFGGAPISFFFRNDALHTDATTNYGRLLQRLQNAGLDGAVRTILFYQGESDDNDGPGWEAGYDNLHSDWLEDYPSIEKFYVFQVRECPCGPVTRFDVDLRNRQRLTADQFSDVTIMSTNALDGHDGCHFYFAQGYENLGLNITRMIQRDLYGGPSLSDTDPPNPAYAVLSSTNNTLIRIPLRNRTDTVTFDSGAINDFEVTGTSATIVSGTIVDGILELTLSGDATGATSVVYTGHSGPATGNWVSNANGVGLISFIEPVLTDNTPPVITLLGPNPVVVNMGGTYTEPGATATDNLDGDLTNSIVIDASAVNTSVPGDYLVTYNVSDVAGNAAPQVTRTVHVNGVPTANPQSITTNENTAVAITLTASDVDGDTLTYSVVASPAHGTLSGTAPNLTYTPAANYSGSDCFTFKANDGTVDSNIATVSITVTAVNHAPVANPQSVTTNENTAIAITLTASDADGDTLTYSVVTGPAHGTLSGTAPNVTYTPAANYSGADSFTFKANDGTVDSNIATVSITVNGVPQIVVQEPAGVDLTGGASTVDFGYVVPGGDNSHTFTIQNAGSADLTGVALAFDGSNPGDWSVTASPAATVAPGDSTCFTIKFSPGALGARSATLHIASNDPHQTSFDVALTGTAITNLEAWRLKYFGSIENSGNGADASDPDGDGLPNLLEFATGSDPTVSSPMPGQLAVNGDTLEFVYTRAKAAMNDGFVFTVEWTDDLTAASWSNSGVTEECVSEDATLQYIKASLSTSDTKKFMHLKVVQP